MELYIAATRRLQNAGVSSYNNLCTEFPSSIIASMTRHKPTWYFRADDEKRKDVEIL